MQLARVLWENAQRYLYPYERLFLDAHEPLAQMACTNGALRFPLSAIIDGCTEGNILLVQWALQGRPRPPPDLTEGGYIALANGHPETFIQLIQMGLKPHPNHLDIAAWHGHADTVKWFFRGFCFASKPRLALLAAESGQFEVMMDMMNLQNRDDSARQCARDLVWFLLGDGIVLGHHPELDRAIKMYCSSPRVRSPKERWAFVKILADAFPLGGFDGPHLRRVLVDALAKREEDIALGIYIHWIKNNPLEADLWTRMTEENTLDGLNWLQAHSDDDLEGPVGVLVLCAGIDHGRLDIVDWVMQRTHYHKQNMSVLRQAIRSGHLKVVKHLRTTYGVPWSSSTCLLAALEGQLDILKHLRLDYNPPCPWNTEQMCGHLGHQIQDKYPGDESKWRFSSMARWLWELKVSGHERLTTFVHTDPPLPKPVLLQ
jgi:hypothetical protein